VQGREPVRLCAGIHCQGESVKENPVRGTVHSEKKRIVVIVRKKEGRTKQLPKKKVGSLGGSRKGKITQKDPRSVKRLKWDDLRRENVPILQ